MSIIHIMKDGTRRASVEGIVIKLPEFYRVLESIHKNRSGKTD